MKVFIIHGDDTQKSYDRLVQFIDSAKKRNWEVVYIEDATVKPREILSIPSLFGDERFFIVKDLKIFTDQDFDFLNKSQISGNLVIYSDKKIPATNLKKIKKIEKTEEFSLPFLVFKFMDYLYPGNTKQILSTFSELTKTQAPEFIFSLISKQIRDLYWSTLDIKPNYPSWRLQKISSQALKYKPGQLKKILSKLSQIDYKAKTGQVNLKDELDLLMLTNLQ